MEFWKEYHPKSVRILMDGQYCSENTRGAYFSTKFDIPTHFDEILERITSKKRPKFDGWPILS
jgi:hypothetical protein